MPEHWTRWRPGSTKGVTLRFLSWLKVRVWSSATLEGGGVDGGSEETELGPREWEIVVGETKAESFSENSKPRERRAEPTCWRFLLGTRMKSV